MADSRLHQVAELGQSVWIDSLSREWLRTGELKRLMEEDAVTGVTSNPTIFQKAMAEGDWYNDQLREVIAREDDVKEIFLQLAMSDIEEACDLMRSRVGRGRGQGRLRLDGGRPEPRVRHRCDDRGGGALPRLGRAAEPLRQDSGHPAGAGRDRGDDRARPEHQRDADLLARAPHGGRRCLHPRSRAAGRVGGRPGQGRLRGQLLRVPCGHRGRPPARRGRAPGAEGQARRREREAGVPELSGEVLRPALGRAWSRRARARNGASGRRPRRRIPSTATCSTSRSSSARGR